MRLTEMLAGAMLSAVMARPLRIEPQLPRHHVPARGNHARPLFADIRDRRRGVETLGPTCGKTCWPIHAWVRMRNHHHLLVETPEANLVAGMNWLQRTRPQRQPKASKHAPRPPAPISASPVETGVFGHHREQNEMNEHQFPGTHSRMTRIGFCERASAGGCCLSSSLTPLAKCHFSRTDPFTFTNLLQCPGGVGLEVDLLEECELAGGTPGFWIEPGDECHLGKALVLARGDYLFKFHFIGSNTREEFWSRIMYMRID
ncbi:MAG: hypothetical protein ABSA47_09600 [Verrucomicrobiota bacterium]